MEEQICKDIEEKIREACNSMTTVEDQQIRDMIDTAIMEKSRETYIPLQSKLRICNQVFHAVRGYDCLEDLLEQEDITEIMVNGYHTVFVERNGVLEAWNGGFSSEEKYMDVIQQMVAGCNRIVNESNPIVDARLKDGSRVNIVLPPVALDGAVMTIRKFPKETYSIQDLVRREMLSDEMAEVLQLLIWSRYNIMISGGTGSGKTTFLNALANQINSQERIITIEDSAELQIREIPNLVRLEVKNANLEGKQAITIKDLIRSALRMRPSRIIVGEVRGEEAIDMLQAMNTGHSGSLSTGHANSAKDMLSRLETMVLMGMELPLLAIRQQIASAIDIIVHLGRLPNGNRKVMEIVEIQGMLEGEIQLHTLYRYCEDKQDGSSNTLNEIGLPKDWKRMEGLQHEEKLKETGCLEQYQKLFYN